jgi:phosphoribosylglycinamide formyltransferase 1
MAKARIAVLISGRGSNMAALIYAAKAPDCPFEIALVISNTPDAAGSALAAAEGIATAALPSGMKAFVAAATEALAEHGIHYVALAGFMRILPPDFVAAWAGRMLNIHPSLLPKYKGLDTHARAIEGGDKFGGCSVHIVTEALDDGDVLAQTQVAILPGDTADTLAARVLIAEHQLYARTLAAYVSRPFDAGWIERQVDRLASALPEVSRKTSHGSPGWAVGSGANPKLFAIIADQHHGADAIGLLVKASGPDEMTGLIEAAPHAYYWPKYYGASGWIGLIMNRADVDWDEVGEWLERSWRACAPPKLTKLMRVAEGF